MHFTFDKRKEGGGQSVSPSSLLLALDVSRLFGFLDPLGVAPTASAPAEVPAPTLPPTAPAVDSSSLTNSTRSGHKLNFFIVLV